MWRRWLVLSPTLFDIDNLLKRYVGGLVVSMIEQAHIGSLAYAMMRVSASLFGGSRKWNDRQLITSIYVGDDVRRFDVKVRVARSFQLESLILAQNERWRQA